MEKVKELTDKIYHEGIEKARKEADHILSDANTQASDIIASANKEAERIISMAKDYAHKAEDRVIAELRMYAKQTFSSVRTAIADMLTEEIVKSALDEVKQDKHFINKLLIEVAGKWAAGESLIVTSASAAALHKYVSIHAKELLDNGLMFRQEDGEQPLFSITSFKNGYKVNFGNAEFENYLKSIIRPQLIRLLFDNETIGMG